MCIITHPTCPTASTFILPHPQGPPVYKPGTHTSLLKAPCTRNHDLSKPILKPSSSELTDWCQGERPRHPTSLMQEPQHRHGWGSAEDRAFQHRASVGPGQLPEDKLIMKPLWNSSQELHHIFSPGFGSQVMTVWNATAEKLYLMSDHAKDYSLIVAYYSLSHTPTICHIAFWLQWGN